MARIITNKYKKINETQIFVKNYGRFNLQRGSL
jgi:hypothetical protein